jgi:hypothetical protein
LLETFGSQAAALTAIQSEEIADRKFTLEVSTANATHRTVTFEPKPCLSWLPSLEVRSDKIAIITLYHIKSALKLAVSFGYTTSKTT